MFDFAHAYNTLANYGTYNKLHFIQKVEDSSGNVIYEYKEEPEEVLDKAYTFIVNELMTTTYDSHFIDYATPTVLSLGAKLDRRFALKSGTTDFDYWITGYNPDILMLVWSGNDYNEKVSNTYSKNKEIWYETVEYALKIKKEIGTRCRKMWLHYLLTPLPENMILQVKKVLYFILKKVLNQHMEKIKTSYSACLSILIII